ncbi:DUF7660 family protein [Brevibacillus sp. NRS-1366]|uniref:DUF7660 family protein n=1 Tax=Brevibacillus sp. NRS-1366 TaxID=3233899 RepID=UPI003D226E3C
MDISTKKAQTLAKEDLISFIESSIIELRGQPAAQENRSRYALLESMAAWLKTSETTDSPSSEAFAKILYVSNYYK